MLMLKTTILLQVLVANKVLVTNKIGGVKGGDELIKKCRKLSKIRKLSKAQKFFKSQKSAKLRKKLSKSGNLFNFDAKKNGQSFLTPNTRTTFNCLRLTFTKALIL